MMCVLAFSESLTDDILIDAVFWPGMEKTRTTALLPSTGLLVCQPYHILKLKWLPVKKATKSVNTPCIVIQQIILCLSQRVTINPKRNVSRIYIKQLK